MTAVLAPPIVESPSEPRPVAAQLTNTGTVWLLHNRVSKEGTSGTKLRALQQTGFFIARSTTVNRTVVIEMTR